MWKQWLDEEGFQQLYNNGYYAQFNKEFNIRFIALNTQVCDNLNFFLIFNNTDPNAQIEFLYQQLNLAEQNKQKVIIFGHIPIGDNTCSSQWALRYQVLIDRFEYIIIGQFFGHTHNDHIESIISSQGEKRSIGSIFIAPSGTTYSFLNPSYRIFEFKNQKLFNYYQYRLDLDNANQNIHKEPTWDLAYDFLSEYQLDDISNDSLYLLAFDKLVNNDNLLNKYILNFNSGNRNLMPKKIDTKVRRNFLCQAQNIIFDDRFKCFGIYGIFYYKLEFIYQFLQTLQGEWLIQN
ncbi:ser thr protein phosphatase family protein, putative [Ichthyophthirius multifiliis]|uniref:Ser thr protein phosphatase family protein, putative n=1 Tax=Ichthyophthirius multifiliis TaxID=5932 RepID=G0QTB4_ICHMU|nr:ser thr protein phosphatase family protein, putative [Ichthyophthirius multifiliis]EGR31549.1 ser thr protein phosphatase family protein, putative [Ichthyophthirius multifiliis]|eukprot:XP_004035035.1 ser thr protein phosphatase family protein, putative [Ichthyophthirius multifiliis]